MVIVGFGYAVLYLVLMGTSQPGWVWDDPARNTAMEHMLYAVYITLGVFLIGLARDPERALPLINWMIVVNLSTPRSCSSTPWACATDIATSPSPVMSGAPTPVRSYSWPATRGGTIGDCTTDFAWARELAAPAAPMRERQQLLAMGNRQTPTG